jgi:hypothetical protein
MAGTLLFLLWEIALLAAAARVALALMAKRPAEEFLALLLSADIALGSLAASAVSFARVNSVAAYVSIAVVLLAAGARTWVARELAARLRQLVLWRMPWMAVLICTATLTVFLIALKPIDEWDSINYLHYLLDWRANRITPYTFATNYVAFWETSFLPPLVLARADWFFAFVALKPVLLLGTALYLVGEQFEIPPRLRIAAVAAAMALQHLWGSHSGVGTLKNDALHAAGVVLLVLVVLRATADLPLAAFGMTFASVKYTGIVLSGIAICALAVATATATARRARRSRVNYRAALAGALLIFFSTGHYYARSLWLYGNPFYPFTVRLPGITLPGTADLTPTSIAANLGDPHLWTLLFRPEHGLSPAGLLFPVVLPATLCAALWVTMSGLRRRPPAFWLGALLLAGWLLYFRTFWGAGPGPHDLGYIANDLSTLRYVEGFLALSELFLVWLLVRRGVPESILLALITIQAASRLWLLHPHPGAIWIAAALLCGGLCVRLPALAPAILALVLVSAAPAIVERNRATWLPFWKEIYQPVRALAPSTIFLLDDPRSGYNAIRFALAGPGLKHDVRSSSDPGAAGGARYAVRVLGAGQPSSDLDAFAARLAPAGYRPVLQARRGIILERMSSTPWTADRAPAWYLAPDRIPAAGGEVDEGGAAASMHRLRDGDLVFSPPDRLLRLDASTTQALEPREESGITLLNGGPIRDGRPLGLAWGFHEGRWRAREKVLAPAGSPYVSIGRGEYRMEKMQDAEGPFVRVRALNDAAWLVLANAIPPLPDSAPYTASCVARCPAGPACTFSITIHHESQDRPAPPSGQWETFRVLRRIAQRASDDHIAVGRQPVRAGDFFDVRELGVIEGFFP